MLMLKKRNLIFLLIITLLIGTLTGGGLYWVLNKNLSDERISVSKEDYNQVLAIADKYKKLESIYQYVTNNYYIPVDSKELEEGMYKGLVWGLGDPYSSYLTAPEYEQMMTVTSGEYDGIGITLAGGTDGYVTVVSPMDGSPAYKAGVKAGDKIIKIDGKNFDNATLDEAAVALRGKSGTKVKITVIRENKNIEFDLTRSKIIMETVNSKILKDDIGYIRISSFEENTSKAFETELRNMEVKGVKGLIIDLRDNGGGLVQPGVEIADMLLPAGLITYTEDRKGNRSDYKSDASYTDIQYVFLVDGGTASTSEIIAAAVKDHKIGKLVGTKTYGKGIIQSVEQMKDGDAVKMTIMRYFSPNGDEIHEIGVTPNYIVEKVGDDSVDEQLEKALLLLKK